MSIRKLSSIDRIIIHCADTPNGYNGYTIADIDDWHAKRGFCRRNSGMALEGASPYRHCGYHYVIHVNGSVHKGRELAEVGAHAAGYNRRSVGVCLIGRDAFTSLQWYSLPLLLSEIREQVSPDVVVIGHREINKNKTCPGFDVQAWLNTEEPEYAQVCVYRGAHV